MSSILQTEDGTSGIEALLNLVQTGKVDLSDTIAKVTEAVASTLLDHTLVRRMTKLADEYLSRVKEAANMATIIVSYYIMNELNTLVRELLCANIVSTKECILVKYLQSIGDPPRRIPANTISCIEPKRALLLAATGLVQPINLNANVVGKYRGGQEED